MKHTLLLTLIAASLALSACGGSAVPSPSQQADQDSGADHYSGETYIELTPAQLQAASIGLAQAGPAVIREVLPVYGVIAPNAERVRDVGARFPGVIRTVIKKVGDPVRQGETLATVESNESLQTYSVVAPLEGVVTARHANPGEPTGDKVLFTVADLSTVWVELSLFPRDIAKVRVGQSVRVKSSDTGLNSEGKVVYVAPFGSATTQTLTARVLLDNKERRWAPGLYVTAEVTLGGSEVPVAVHNEALQSVEGRNVAFVHGEKGFRPQPVRIGRSDSEWSEVLDGLRPGESYAVANSFILKAELGKGSAEHED